METKAPKEGGNITILVLGDEGVGKSSLVSTFVSRHFSELVPPIITRVRIPPDAQLANCTSTIIDTQEGDVALADALSLSSARLGSRGSLASISADSISSWGKKADEPIIATSTKPSPAAALLAAASPYRNVDAIILVYDLERSDTFDRLCGHWLPLIDKCYDGEMPVIIAGNKMDLQSSSATASVSTDNQHPTGSRQEIISLLQQFMFVRQCIKCSAKNLLNIDEVFKKAQQAVLYPINPLYDLNTGRLTAACTRALSRIFRIFDRDSDGLLSDTELNAFQQEVWGVTLMERDVSSWKKVVVEHDSFCRIMAEDASGESCVKPVLREGKFTLQGFLTIFDVFITQNRLEVPWKALRSFGYDDDLNLVVPLALSECDDFSNIVVSKWRLSDEEKSFLANLFHRYDSDKDGVLASSETRKVFSVLSNPLPSWSERGRSLFDGCPSLPRIENEGTSPASSMIGVPFDTAFEMSPLPNSTHESSPDSPSMLSASGITISSSPLPSVDVSKDTTPPSGVGLRPISFLTWMNHWHMLCIVSPSVFRLELYRLGYVYNATTSKDLQESSRRRVQTKQELPRSVALPSLFVRALVVGCKASGSGTLIRKLHCDSKITDTTYDHPETSCSVSKMLLPKHNSKNDAANVETAVHLILTHVPLEERSNNITWKQKKLVTLLQEGVYDMAVLVYNSPETFNAVKSFDKSVMNYKMPRIFVSTAPMKESTAIEYCQDNKLEPPCVADVDQPQLDPAFIEYLIQHAQKPRYNASRRRKLLWLGGLVTAGITVVIGLTIGRKKKNANDKGWFKCLLDLVSF